MILERIPNPTEPRLGGSAPRPCLAIDEDENAMWGRPPGLQADALVGLVGVTAEFEQRDHGVPRRPGGLPHNGGSDFQGSGPNPRLSPLPDGRGFHEKAGPCQAKSRGLRGLAPWRSMRQRLICAPSSAPSDSRPSTPVSADQRKADRRPRSIEAPFPSS